MTTEDLRILLWDIDGTLVRSARTGAFKDYTAPVLESVFGTSGRLAEMTVSGMTDLQIVLEALRDEGYTHEQVRERFGDLRALYIAEMERVTNSAEYGVDPLFQLLAGAREILEATRAHPRYLSALLTGNIEPAAHLKMRLVGLSEFFTLPGAYGDDSHDRRDLPALAQARINRRLGLLLRPSQFIVIGDTPNDISAARHFGARVVAVATGRMNSVETLAPHEPDIILHDLSDTEAVMRAFDSL
ncbi:MAG TPA: HAD hydrolase-like protein [Pyrinomonadaceae bacterium]|jgi:phosphoglycolate phosphatase-like HAD superfamily hydrolase|nr:HAD hydrolase-like protein [Pyrinomonadaceae bacterium]